VDDAVNTKDNEEEESKDLILKNAKIAFIAKLFKDNSEWRNGILGLKEMTVLKMRRILQSVFYLLKYKRADVCLEGTNKFFWKSAKKYMNEHFLKALASYSPFGVKSESQPEYTTLNFLDRNLEGITQEEVDA
jgi:hypothetical protein